MTKHMKLQRMANMVMAICFAKMKCVHPANLLLQVDKMCVR